VDHKLLAMAVDPHSANIGFILIMLQYETLQFNGDTNPKLVKDSQEKSYNKLCKTLKDKCSVVLLRDFAVTLPLSGINSPDRQNYLAMARMNFKRKQVDVLPRPKQQVLKEELKMCCHYKQDWVRLLKQNGVSDDNLQVITRGTSSWIEN
jgi:hypothetical protein